MSGQQAVRPATWSSWFRWSAGGLLLVLVFSLNQVSGQEKKPPQSIAAQKAQSLQNLKQLALAVLNYADTFNGKLPSSAYIDELLVLKWRLPPMKGEELAALQRKFKAKPLPLLSWRVAILPFLGEEKLYHQFNREEPWDSAHNKRLLAKMPKVFAPVRGKTKAPGMTYYQVFVGPGAPFDGSLAARLPREFRDGTSNTFLIVEAGEAVPWTAPQDIPYDRGKPVPKLGGLFADGFHAAMADGAIRFIPRGTDEAVLRAVITHAGGESVEAPGKEVSKRPSKESKKPSSK
jgi:hypothetical protein